MGYEPRGQSFKIYLLRAACGILFGIELSLCMIFSASSAFTNSEQVTVGEQRHQNLKGMKYNKAVRALPGDVKVATEYQPMQILDTINVRKDTEEIEKQKSKPASGPNVLFPVITGNKSRKEVALTFDDGFQKTSVQTVLKVLKKHEIRTTFFITGKALISNSYLWKQAIDDGHQICNHTYNHSALNRLGDTEIKNELKMWEQTVDKVLGKEYLLMMKESFPYFRLPGGNGSKDKRVLKVVTELGYVPIGWSDETYYSVLRHYDLKKAPLEKVSSLVVNHITGNLKNGAIILLHFNSFDTYKLDEMVDGILKKGYKIKSVTEILE